MAAGPPTLGLGGRVRWAHVLLMIAVVLASALPARMAFAQASYGGMDVFNSNGGGCSNPYGCAHPTYRTGTQSHQPNDPPCNNPYGCGRGRETGPNPPGGDVYCQKSPGQPMYGPYRGTGTQTPCNLPGSTNYPRNPSGAGNGPPTPIEIRFRAFIPAPAVAVSPQDPTHQIRCFLSGMVNLDDCLFRGDNRGFSYSQGTQRFIQNIVLQGTNANIYPWFCRTHEYYPSQGYHPSDKPWWWYGLNPGAHEVMSDQLRPGPDNNGVQVTNNINSTVVTMWLRGANPLVAGPPIDANFTIALYYQPGQPLTAIVSGAHDGFPAYELYINGQMITGQGLPYNPAKSFGASPFSLINSVIPQVQVNAGPTQINARFRGGSPPNPAGCN